MIVFIEGVLVEKQPTRAVVQAGGVGYELLIPLSSYDRLPKAGETCRLRTHHHVREDAQTLYGFCTEDEQTLFERLIGVTGIGPRTALSALSGMTPRDLKRAIVEGDVKRLSSLNGIGRKTAERLVVELKDRIPAGEALEAVSGGPEPPDDPRRRDAVQALTALGYKQPDAVKMVAAVAPDALPDDVDVEELVRRALSGRAAR